MMLREAGLVAAAGLAIGIVLAMLAGRTAETLLFGLRSRDLATYAAAAVAVVAVTAIAAAIPARRASRVSPTLALRAE
jgi:ABC-type antimicrobial peptide transport system permease subunit